MLQKVLVIPNFTTLFSVTSKLQVYEVDLLTSNKPFSIIWWSYSRQRCMALMSSQGYQNIWILLEHLPLLSIVCLKKLLYFGFVLFHFIIRSHNCISKLIWKVKYRENLKADSSSWFLLEQTTRIKGQISELIKCLSFKSRGAGF